MGETSATTPPGSPRASLRWLSFLLLACAVGFFVLHFVYLAADFPNDSPWMDWAKYTDEGWYADAAVRHALFGHWYLAGDFNPAVALPVWPLLLAGVFHFAGVSMSAARATAVACFGVMACLLYWLIQRFASRGDAADRKSLAAPMAMLFLSTNPFFYAFDRLAILEPLLSGLGVAALLCASYLEPWGEHKPWSRGWLLTLWLSLLLGVLLPVMVLTKTTAIALIPAIVCMVWYRAGRQVGAALRSAALPFALGVFLWSAYMLVLVRPHHLDDYQYLFSANAYTGFQLQPLATVLFNTFADGYWMGGVLYPVFVIGLVLFLFVRPGFFRSPLVMSLLCWMGGYFAFLAYHNNLQPRYYLVPAVPLTALVALMLDDLRFVAAGHGRRYVGIALPLLCASVASAIVVPDALLQVSFFRHPEYTYAEAADAIAKVIRTSPSHAQRVLSVSGSDLTLMTGLPSIDDDFGTLDLDQRIRQYRPGWYVAWNQIDDDKMDALTPLYQPVRIATYPVMDDPDRNQLILYRLDPAAIPTPLRRRRLRTPRPLRTRLGQQPTITQLQH